MISALFAEEKAEKLKKGPNLGEPNSVEKPAVRSRKRAPVEVVASSKPGDHPDKRGRLELTEPVGFGAGRGRGRGRLRGRGRGVESVRGARGRGSGLGRGHGRGSGGEQEQLNPPHENGDGGNEDDEL